MLKFEVGRLVVKVERGESEWLKIIYTFISCLVDLNFRWLGLWTGYDLDS
jgi:hypothetical protein